MVELLVTYNSQRRLIPKRASYELLIDHIRATFKLPADKDIVLHYYRSRDPLQSVRLHAEGYDALQTHGSDIIVEVAGGNAKEPKTLFIRYDENYIFSVNITGHMTIEDIKKHITQKTGYEAGFLLLEYCEKPLDEDSKTLQDYGIVDESTIKVNSAFGIAKQAIYVRKPTHLSELNISVTLSCKAPLIVADMFGNPLNAGPTAMPICWDDVTVTDDGHLHPKNKPSESYRKLGWRGETFADPNRLMPHANHPNNDSDGQEVFRMSRPSLTPTNACVLDIGEFVPFLEQTLTKFGLSPDMRTNCVLTWAPHLQRISHYWDAVAFRFVDQAAVCEAARISVKASTQLPLAMVRVYLLFGGVNCTRPNWRRSLKSLPEALDVNWAEKIGLNTNEVQNEALLRVIEIGGMEVPLFSQN